MHEQSQKYVRAFNKLLIQVINKLTGRVKKFKKPIDKCIKFMYNIHAHENLIFVCRLCFNMHLNKPLLIECCKIIPLVGVWLWTKANEI